MSRRTRTKTKMKASTRSTTCPMTSRIYSSSKPSSSGSYRTPANAMTTTLQPQTLTTMSTPWAITRSTTTHIPKPSTRMPIMSMIPSVPAIKMPPVLVLSLPILILTLSMRRAMKLTS